MSVSAKTVISFGLVAIPVALCRAPQGARGLKFCGMTTILRRQVAPRKGRVD